MSDYTELYATNFLRFHTRKTHKLLLGKKFDIKQTGIPVNRFYIGLRVVTIAIRAKI